MSDGEMRQQRLFTAVLSRCLLPMLQWATFALLRCTDRTRLRVSAFTWSHISWPQAGESANWLSRLFEGQCKLLCI